MSFGEGRIPFEPDRADVNPDTHEVDGVEADQLASGVDPKDLGLPDDARPEDAEPDDT